jgi:hypothetical protein
VARSGKGGSAGFLFLLLIALVGVVAWNYRRNLQAESRDPRPYRSYSEADLAALIEAYEPAAEAAGARYGSAVDRRAEARSTGHFLGNVREFERVQAVARATREARSEYASARAALEALRAEQARRARDRSALAAFLRRAFAF